MDINKLQELTSNRILVNEPMRNHTTWKIGGPADLLIQPASADELAGVLTYLSQEKTSFTVIGNGSNILVSDSGIRGVIIKLADNYSRIHWADGEVEAEAGTPLSLLAFQAAEHSFSGLEFAAGIPGTVAGAVIMNAGAYGDSIGRYVTKVMVLEYTGTKRIITAEEMTFDYRESSVFNLPVIICSVFLKLARGNKEESLGKMHRYLKMRREKQPLEHPSCGSVFRNPPGDHAGRLIEAAGLRGVTVGGAMISRKHGNFIINLDNAQAADVLALIEKAQNRVYDLFGIKLEPEVKRVGDFS